MAAAKQTTYADAQTRGFAGQLLANSDGGIKSMINNEATVCMPFGCAVAFEGATDDKGALLPDSISDVVAGILLHSHSYVNETQLGFATLAASNGAASEDVGPKPGQMLNVLRKGQILAKCVDGCSPGDRLHVRAVATSTEQEGELRASADGSDTIDCTNQGVWMDTAVPGGLARLEVDFTNSPTIVDPAS